MKGKGHKLQDEAACTLLPCSDLCCVTFGQKLLLSGPSSLVGEGTEAGERFPPAGAWSLKPIWQRSLSSQVSAFSPAIST